MIYRLIDEIARRRMRYPAPVPTLATVLVLDIPERHRGSNLALGRYYAIFLENDDEWGGLTRFLGAARPAAVLPDLLDQRLSTLRADRIVLSRYDPPAPGWPWLSVCRFPESGNVPSGSARLDMARGCYTVEMFDSPRELERHQFELLSRLAEKKPLTISMAAGESLAEAGRS